MWNPKPFQRALRYEWKHSWMQDHTLVGVIITLFPMMAWGTAFLHGEYLVMFDMEGGIPVLSWFLSRPVALLITAAVTLLAHPLVLAWRTRGQYTNEVLARERRLREEFREDMRIAAQRRASPRTREDVLLHAHKKTRDAFTSLQQAWHTAQDYNAHGRNCVDLPSLEPAVSVTGRALADVEAQLHTISRSDSGAL